MAQARYVKARYYRKTGDPHFTRQTRGRLFSVYDRLTWDLIAKLRLDRHYPHSLARYLTRKKGMSEMWTTYNRRARVLTINKIIFNKDQSTKDWLRDMKQLFADIEKQAHADGARFIETDFTIIPPTVARRLGLEVLEQTAGRNPLYKYQKPVY